MMRCSQRAAAFVAGVVLFPAVAGAQAESTAPPAAADTAAPAPAPAPDTTTAPLSRSVIGGYGNPQAPNGTIGGGNATESSSHPVTGDEEDSFDFGGHGHGAGVARGGDNGPIFSGGGGAPGIHMAAGETPDAHTVRRGDTLWGICDFYFRNPYEWPRVWSYNAQIRNPNWIYPGDEVHLKAGGAAANAPQAAGGGDTTKMTLVDRRRQVPNDTVFLRDQGWIQDESDDVWGEVTGTAEETMFLASLNEVYLTLRKDHDVRIGQELTIFHTRETVAAGAVVQILGTVRIDQWNQQDHVARAQIVESLDVIERGSKVGPLSRRFAIVPPRRNDADVQARVLASVHPNEFFGQNQVVFVDKGDAAGLKPGNRLFVVRHGDAWRQTLVTADAAFRISADDERPMPPMEKTPGSRRDDDRYPDEVVAELRVLAVKKDSAVCLVTQARSEIELRDLVVARKGY